jgi:Xaa-Pro aminopeptidase
MTTATQRPADYLPTLSLAERDRRWRTIREGLALQRLDGLVLFANDSPFGFGTANLRYLTQIGNQHGGAVVFPLDGEPIVLHAPPHMHEPFNFYSVAQDWVTDIRPFSGVRSIVEALEERGIAGGRLGLVGFRTGIFANTIPHLVVTELEQSLPGARISDVTPMVEQARLIKSAEEIGMLERAGALSRAAIVRLHDTAAPGVTELEVTAAMAHEAIRLGGEPNTFNLMTSGPVDGPEDVWHLVHGVETQTQRPLAQGDVIMTEFHTSWGGYLSGSEFTVHLGTPPAQLQRIWDVGVETLASYDEAMRPGKTVREALEIVRRPCLDAGLDYVELGFHGHGLASPEFPTVTYKEGIPLLSSAGLGDVVLREGMVFGTNIDLFDPNWKTNVGIMLGDMLVIEADGPRFLVNVPLELFVKE